MIVLYPDPILRQKAKKIAPEEISSPEIQELIFNMLETMEKNDGVGLAAPQIGKSLRLCVMKNEGKTYVLINPKFKSKSWRKVVAEEGCLSFPGKFLSIKRSALVKVFALDKNGQEIVLKADGLLSRALQHEIDHLDGVLFIDRAVKNKKEDEK
jgi:peptide deformylase